MIPYEQLVSALTSWRQRHGLPTTSADVFGEAPGQAHAMDHGGLRHGGAMEGMEGVEAVEAEDAVEGMIDEDAIVDEESRGFDDPESTAISSGSSDYTTVEAYEDDALLDVLDGRGDDDDEPKR